MANYARQFLSGSTNGAPQKITQTAIASGDTVHTAINAANSFDEVYVWVCNPDIADHTITIGWGGVTDPDNLVCKSYTILANSPPVPILTGMSLGGGLLVKMAADVANKVIVFGHVNRIS